jgi:lipid A 3-O-deacylase
MRSRIACLTALLLLASALPASGASLVDEALAVREQGRVRNELTIDNDSLLLNRDDGLYTSGFLFDRQYALRRQQDSVAYGWRLGQALFSPLDIKLPPSQIGPPDHPYAGWLFAGVYRELASAAGGNARVGIDLGCIGPCAGGETVQTNLHRLLRQPLPQGWAKQVKNEAGFVAYADMAPMRWQLGSEVDLTPHFHSRFGNIFTDAGLGLTMRAGPFDRSAAQAQFHVFARADVNVVAYNATLQGAYFSGTNPHTVTPKRVVGEMEVGAAWQSVSLGVRASVLRRTNEISGLPNSIGAQNFVRLQFSTAQ